MTARAARACRRPTPTIGREIDHNRDRDVKTLAVYAAMGWRVLVVHECELKDKASLGVRLTEALRTQQAASGKSE